MAPVTARAGTARLVVVSLLLFLGGIIGGRHLAGDPDPVAVPPELRAPASIDASRVAGEPPALPAPAAFAGFDPGPEPTGDGAIRGVVATEDGRPLAGVRVRAEPYAPYRSPRPGGPPPAGDPMLPEIEAEVCQLMLARRGSREATSDSSGSFLLTGIADLEYGVVGHKPGYEIRRLGRSDVRAGHEVRLVARPVVELAVRVLGPDGEAPDRALLKIRCTGRYVSTHRTWTPANPTIELDPGPVRIRAVAGERDSLASGEVDRRLEVGVRPDPVVLELREQAGIHGTLTFPPAHMSFHNSYRILALRVREGGDVAPARLLRERHHETDLHRYSPRRGTGRFSMAGLPAGTYLVGVADGYRSVKDSAVVQVAGGMETVDLEVLPPGAGEATTVRVFDPEGRPLGGRMNVQIQARHVAADGTYSYGARADFLGEGTWRVLNPPVPPGKDAGGRYLLRVRSRGHGEIDAEYEPGATEAVVRFAAPAHLTVVLPGYAGSRYEGAAKIAVMHAGGGRGRREIRPDAQGRAAFGPLSPGDWIVRLYVDSGKHGSAAVHEERLRLASGAEEIRLDPHPLFNLTIAHPGDGTSFRLQSLDSHSWRYGERGEDGAVRFERIPAGEYTLWRYGPDESSSMPLRVKGDRTVRFEPTIHDALRVSITDPEGRLAKAGLRDGDLVTAIAGTEIVNAAQSSALLTLKADAGPVELTVLRGAVRLTIRMDLTGVRDARRSGGMLTPWPR